MLRKVEVARISKELSEELETREIKNIGNFNPMETNGINWISLEEIEYLNDNEVYELIEIELFNENENEE